MMLSKCDNVLAIDSATAVLRLAVQFGGDRLVRSEEQVDRAHGMVIMKKIQNLLSSSGVGIGDLHAIVVNTGPGSFTGLRVGIAAAKGIAVTLDIPVKGVNLFEIAAGMLPRQGDPIAVVVPFKRDEVFVGEIRHGRCEIDQVRAIALSDLAAALRGRPAVAIGLDLQALAPDTDAPPSGRLLNYDAGDLLRLGVGRLKADGCGDPIETLEPLYVVPCQAEIKFERRHTPNR